MARGVRFDSIPVCTCFELPAEYMHLFLVIVLKQIPGAVDG